MRTVIAALAAWCVVLVCLACAHAAPPGAELPGAVAAVAVEPGAVDLNRATESDLIALPHIGPTKAAAIVAYRNKHGAFTRVDELRRVKGFGRKTVANLRSMVTVTRPEPARAPAPAPKEGAAN